MNNPDPHSRDPTPPDFEESVAGEEDPGAAVELPTSPPAGHEAPAGTPPAPAKSDAPPSSGTGQA
ncbi:hypothetical protein [Variovorax soli]|uniref:Uncharacterized protein n=1 Tax=Variovorax soli TaxID=376815 RepID=A0ABU1NA14_9BURK|nr:hypothetical protein [Variovorax soli]MDR6535270.1 hypothetical protein [Variovorax soli]